MTMQNQYDAIIIGAGFGGIGTALSLAEKGFKVALFESLRYPGGCAGTFTRRGYRFEAGATLSSGFDEQQLFGKWIKKYGLDIQLEWLSPMIHFRSSTIDIDIPSEKDALIQYLCELPNAPKEGIKAFFKHQGQVADALWALFDDPDLLPPWNLQALIKHAMRFPKYLPILRNMNRSLAQVLQRFGIDDFKPLKIYLDALCQITVQCNSDQAEAPFALATMDYYYRGTAHAIGGMGKLANELCKAITLCGGEVHLSNKVKGIKRIDEGYQVETRKGTYLCKYLISNLLPEQTMALYKSSIKWPKWLEKTQEDVDAGWSAAMLYLVAETPPGTDGKAEHWQMVHSTDEPFMEGNHIFCSTSSIKETDRAPFGSQTLTISTHIPMKKFLSLSDEEKGPYIDKVHNRMRETLQTRCPEWSEQVYFAMTASPRTFERFTSRSKGLVGGIPKTKGWHHYMQLGPKKLASHFYLVGDSIFPGQSTLATATGGCRIAESIWRSAPKKNNQLVLTTALNSKVSS